MQIDEGRMDRLVRRYGHTWSPAYELTPMAPTARVCTLSSCGAGGEAAGREAME